MKKTMKKTWAVILSLAMMLMLIVPAFAVEVDDANTAATLNKIVKKADVELPEATFNFKFENIDAPKGATKIAKQDVTAKFEKKDFIQYEDNTAVYTSKRIKDLFSEEQVNEMKRTPEVYVYKVTEEEVKDFTADNDELTTDDKEYKVFVRVSKDGINGIWVADENGDKRDGTNDPSEMDPFEDNITGCTFVDTYTVKTEDVDPEKPFDPETEDTYQFFTGNTVTGKYGDKELPFNYTVTLENKNATKKLEAYKLTKGQKPEHDKKVAIEYGKPAKVALKHGEFLVIREGLEPGTKFTVEQAEVEDYTTEATLDGKAVNGIKVAATVTAEANKKVAYVNNCTKEDMNPTGVLIQNLPYILLAVVAAGGILYYFQKTRKENA